MKQQTDRSPVSGALPLPVAVNLNQVPGCQARRAVTGFIAFLRSLGSIHHLREPPPVGEGLFQAVYKIRERFHYQTEDDAADEQQTLLPGHAGADEHRGNDYEQCCHLVFQSGTSPFLSVARTARRPLVRASLLIHGQG